MECLLLPLLMELRTMQSVPKGVDYKRNQFAMIGANIADTSKEGEVTDLVSPSPSLNRRFSRNKRIQFSSGNLWRNLPHF